MRSGVGHAATAARRTETAALAREGDDAIESAAVAVHAQESVRKDPAAQEGAEFPRDEAGHRSLARGGARQERLEFLLHDLVEIARFGLAARVGPLFAATGGAMGMGNRKRLRVHPGRPLPASYRPAVASNALESALPGRAEAARSPSNRGRPFTALIVATSSGTLHDLGRERNRGRRR